MLSEFTLEIQEPDLTSLFPHFFVSLFPSAKNVTFTFHAVLWTSIHQSYIFSYFEISKYVTPFLVSCLLPSKYVISAVFF